MEASNISSAVFFERSSDVSGLLEQYSSLSEVKYSIPDRSEIELKVRYHDAGIDNTVFMREIAIEDIIQHHTMGSDGNQWLTSATENGTRPKMTTSIDVVEEIEPTMSENLPFVDLYANALCMFLTLSTLVSILSDVSLSMPRNFLTFIFLLLSQSRISDMTVCNARPNMTEMKNQLVMSAKNVYSIVLFLSVVVVLLFTENIIRVLRCAVNNVNVRMD